MLNDERRATTRFMKENNFVVIKDYPANGVFKENEFYQMDNDVYINVVDSGNGERAVMYSTVVYSRFSANRFSLDTTLYYTRYSNYGPHSNGTLPVEFRYGTYTALNPTGSALEEFMSEGFQSALQYVGDRGKVKMIVPFKVGSQVDMQSGYPVFFEIVEYKFADNL
jgi:hypothetical protein